MKIYIKFFELMIKLLVMQQKNLIVAKYIIVDII